MAANLALVGLGTDTGNSVRGPASHCNLVGMRPTLGLTSRCAILALYHRLSPTVCLSLPNGRCLQKLVLSLSAAIIGAPTTSLGSYWVKAHVVSWVKAHVVR